MYASNYFETVIINLMRQTEFNSPGPLYIGLFYNNPTDTGGSVDYEVGYGGYVRQRINFSMEGNYSIKNTDTITFPESNVTVSSPVQFVGVYDSVSGTPSSSSSVHMWLYGMLAVPLTIQANVSPVFRPGAIKWTMNGNISSTYARNILETLRGNVSKIDPFQPYIGLFNGDPNNGGSEFSGNDYERIPVTFAQPVSDSASATASITSNSSDIVSPNPASGYWGNLTHAGIFTARTGGSLFSSVPLSSSYVMNEGSVAGFREGQLTFSVN